MNYHQRLVDLSRPMCIKDKIFVDSLTIHACALTGLVVWRVQHEPLQTLSHENSLDTLWLHCGSGSVASAAMW